MVQRLPLLTNPKGFGIIGAVMMVVTEQEARSKKQKNKFKK